MVYETKYLSRRILAFPGTKPIDMNGPALIFPKLQKLTFVVISANGPEQ